jgi:hypothetical protein
LASSIYTNSQKAWKNLPTYFHKGGGVNYLQTSTAHVVISMKNSCLQVFYPTHDYLAAQELYVQVPILTGSVQTDKQHAHKMYSSPKLLMQ